MSLNRTLDESVVYMYIYEIGCFQNNQKYSWDVNL